MGKRAVTARAITSERACVIGTRAVSGQVLLAERWAAAHPAVKVVTCHPGWTLTDGVEAAYGDRPAPRPPGSPSRPRRAGRGPHARGCGAQGAHGCAARTRASA